MLRGYRRYILTAVGGVALFSLAAWWALEPREPQLPPYEGLQEQDANYRPGGSGCDPARLRALKGKASDERDRCQEAAEEHRLKKNDLIQQARSADAAEAIMSLTFLQARLTVLGLIAGLLTLSAAIFAAWYARQAAREAKRGSDAAERAVDTAQTEVSPSFTTQNERVSQDETTVRFSLDLKNTGQTPAHGVMIWKEFEFCRISKAAVDLNPSGRPLYIGTVGRDGVISFIEPIELPLRLAKALQRNGFIHVKLEVRFVDAFKVSWVYAHDFMINSESIELGMPHTIECRHVLAEIYQQEQEAFQELPLEGGGPKAEPKTA